MAIAFDAKTDFTYNASLANLTYSHTCSGSDRILFVGVTIRATRTISGITYNSVSMTEVTNYVEQNGVVRNYLFALVAPATGSNTVSITQSAADTITSCSISYTGAKQNGVPDASDRDEDITTTSHSQSVTTVADNCIGVLYGNAAGGLTLTAGTNTTIRNQSEVLFTGAHLLDTTTKITPAGTMTLAVTSGSQTFTTIMASFAPFTAETFTPKMMMF